jgi:hypothetical protein
MSVPYFGIPFATSGDLLTGGVVPSALQPDGSISYTLGWGTDYELVDTAPGYKPVGRKEMNTLFNAVTSAIGEIQKQGFPSYVAAAAPYPINAVVRYANTYWRSTVVNNSTVPGAVGATWVDVSVVPAASETVAGVAEVATTLETTTGTDDTRMITPLKLAQRLTAYLVQATETVFGWAKVATQVLTDAGVDDTTIVTPKKMRNGFVLVTGLSGYIALPTWMGGFIFQWGAGTITAGATVTVSFPIPFPNQYFRSITSHGAASGAVATSTGSTSLSAITLNMGPGGTGTVQYFSVGR